MARPIDQEMIAIEKIVSYTYRFPRKGGILCIPWRATEEALRSDRRQRGWGENKAKSLCGKDQVRQSK